MWTMAIAEVTELPNSGQFSDRTHQFIGIIYDNNNYYYYESITIIKKIVFFNSM